MEYSAETLRLQKIADATILEAVKKYLSNMEDCERYVLSCMYMTAEEFKERVQIALYPRIAETMVAYLKQKLLITGVRDPLMWYADKVGELVPFVGMVEDGDYYSREPSGYINIVRKGDAEVELVFEDNIS